MSITDLLKQIPLFESLNDSERRRLESLLQRRSLEKGEILFHKGDIGSTFYIIIKGLIKIGVSNKLGDEVTLALLRDGDFFGEMALLDEQPRSADATALEDSILYVLDRSDFFPFLIENENAVHSILRALSMRLRRTDDLFAELSFLRFPPAWPNAFLNWRSRLKLTVRNPGNIASRCPSGNWPPCWALLGKVLTRN